MAHAEILESMTGLMLSMFVAMLSSTVVSNALPRILHDLHGGESAYTWVVTATLLATTAATPLWGKLSDLTSKKLLMQLAILVFITGSVVAGLSQSIGMLIGCRVVQGVGAGGILAMTQVIMAFRSSAVSSSTPPGSDGGGAFTSGSRLAARLHLVAHQRQCPTSSARCSTGWSSPRARVVGTDSRSLRPRAA